MVHPNLARSWVSAFWSQRTQIHSNILAFTTRFSVAFIISVVLGSTTVCITFIQQGQMLLPLEILSYQIKTMPKWWSFPPKKTHWLSFGYKTSVHFQMVHNMHSTHNTYLEAAAAVEWSLLNSIQKWHLWRRGLNTLWGHPTLSLYRNSVLRVPSAALESLGVLNSRIWRDGPCGTVTMQWVQLPTPCTCSTL